MIALINPPPKAIIEGYDRPDYGHIGLAYLASSLRREGLDAAVFDAKLGRIGFDQLVGKVVAAKPALVGVTSFTHEISVSAALVGRLKERLPATQFIIGGVHASSMPLETLAEFPQFDYVVKGEGERALPRLIKLLLEGKDGEAEGLSGLACRIKNKPRLNPSEDWIGDLDSLPFPAWDLFPAMAVYPVMSSRGCPFGCVFCSRMLGEKVRMRSPENVIYELTLLVERYGAKRVYFYDETFGFYRDWLRKFSDLMVERNLLKKIRWGITTRAHLIDEEYIDLIKRAGCVKIDFGVESGDERILKIIKKGETKEDFLRAATIVKKSGIESHSYYILGHPYETKESAMNTIDFASRLNTDRLSIGIMIPYPGTEVARLAVSGEGGYKALSANWADYNKQLGSAIELKTLSRQDLAKLQLLGYLKFYISNLKIRQFFLDLWAYRKLIFSMLVKYLRVRKG